MDVLDHLRIEGVRHLVAALDRAVARLIAGIGLGQQRVEVEVVVLGLFGQLDFKLGGGTPT